MFRSVLHDNHLRLVNVKLHGSRCDNLLSRQRFEAALADLDPATFGLPPHALLIVKQIAPTARLRLDPCGRSAAFVQSVHTELTLNVQRARWPWIQADAARAEAVLFVDESEVMACLLQDWLQGRLAERWWWRTVLRDFSAPEWWRREVLPRGDVLPAVLSLLASKDVAVAWVARLSEIEVTQAVAAITMAHALSSLSGELDPAPRMPPKQALLTDSSQLLLASGQAAIIACRRLLVAIPELQASMLTFHQRRLLTIALGLQRAPAWVRSEEFRTALQLLEKDSAFVSETSKPGKTGPLDSTLDKPWSDLTETVSAIHVAELLPKTQDQISPNQPVLANTVPTDSSNQAIQIDNTSNIQFEHAIRISSEKGSNSITPVISANNATESVETYLPSIETRYGGIFYLLNVALALGLYGDFTQPRNPGIALSPWDWLALIGRAWFRKDFEQDAVWRLLAELAGRPSNQSLGSGFIAPDSWVMPDEWLKPWERAGKAQIYATRRRVQIWHEAGFIIVDVRRNQKLTPLAQIHQLCTKHITLGILRLVRTYKPPQKLVQQFHGGNASGRWLRWILLYLNARLARALDDDTPDALARLVCCHVAKIHYTAMTLNVHLSLADLPIAVRIAGLDRDPGWIPAAGHTITFHFQ